MDLRKTISDRGISVLKLSKELDMPYTTLAEIVNNKVNLEDCSYKNLHKVAAYLNVSIEEMIK